MKIRTTEIVLALIAASAFILVDYRQLHQLEEKLKDRKLAGRVVDDKAMQAVGQAKVTLISENRAFLVRHTDSEGMFKFPLATDSSYFCIRVEANGYEPADRLIILGTNKSTDKDTGEIYVIHVFKASSISPSPHWRYCR